MAFNNESERMKFFRKQERQAAEYRAAGMSEEAIISMFEYDCEQFKRERIYRMHMQELPDQIFEDDGDMASEDNSALMEKFTERLSVSDDMAVLMFRSFSWTEDIGDRKIYRAVKKLNENEFRILTLYVQEERQEQEIAAELGMTTWNVYKNLERIKKKIRETQKESASKRHSC